MSQNLIIHGYALGPDEISFSYARSSGPGGQHVNKVQSKVILKWRFLDNKTLPAYALQRLAELYATKLNKAQELCVQSQKFRDQSRNRQDCLEKLEVMVAQALRQEKTRHATRPSRSAVETRIKIKKLRSEKKRQRNKISWD